MPRQGGDVDLIPRVLPRGRHTLSRHIVEGSQRERLLEGVTLAVAERGYAAATVADITRRAGVSRTTFYEQFRDKEECFLRAYELGAKEHIEYVAEAGREHSHWLDQFNAGTAAYLRFLADRPDWSRTFLIEILAAGPQALALRQEAHLRYVALLKVTREHAREDYPHLPNIPDEVYEAGVAAVNETVVQWVARGQTADLVSLEAVIAYIHLALMGLAEPAGRLFPARKSRRRRR